MRGARLLAGPLAAAAGFGLLLLPGARRLPSYHPTRYHGVENMRDAVNACRQTGLQGWDLVAYAQKLVSHKFAVYSTLNLWDPPNRAFIYGMGYCTQYNLALKNLLRRLGFAPEAVFAMKVRVFDNEAWTMGHTWLRVTIDGETRAVCAGQIENEPGKVSFVPLSPVRAGHPLTLFLTHVGLIFFVGFLEWRALLTSSQPPDWSYRPRLPAASQAQT